MLKWNAIETDKENLKIEGIQLIAMGWHEVQWKGPKHAKMKFTKILKSGKELKQTGRRRHIIKEMQLGKKNSKSEYH